MRLKLNTCTPIRPPSASESARSVSKVYCSATIRIARSPFAWCAASAALSRALLPLCARPSSSVRPGAPLMLPAGLVGALLVLVADLVGQFAFDTRYPVGVITGALGAPFLVYLLIRSNRSGGSL